MQLQKYVQDDVGALRRGTQPNQVGRWEKISGQDVAWVDP